MSMSLQGALFSSASSLHVAQDQIGILSNNIANANTTGYAQEQLSQSELVGNGFGEGVVAGAVQTLADQAASASANQAASAAAYSGQMNTALTNYTNVLGQASSTSSLPAQLSAFTAALTTLSSTPADSTSQMQVVNAATSLVQSFNGLSQTIQTERQQADQAIATGVAGVNDALAQLASVQSSLRTASVTGQPTAALENQQNQLLVGLSKQLPVRVIQGGNDSITLTTDQGTTLYDGVAHPLSFAATPTIPPNMRVNGNTTQGMIGGLSQVTVNGFPISMSQSGAIAANLQLRDVTLPGFSNQLDTMAGNLIATFQGADPTVTAGQTGLFTAGGAALSTTNPASVPGLASTIAVNSLVDPAQGGNSALVSLGVHATQMTSTSATTVIGFVNALGAAASANTIPGLQPANSLSDAMSQVAGEQQSVATIWSNLNTSRSQQATDTRTALSNKTGVNIDDQMQRLLIVQQTYQSSAEVIRTASSMIDSLLSIIH